jgi:flagellar FliL protein
VAKAADVKTSEANPAEEVEAPKKSRKGLWLILSVVVLAAAGGGGFFFWKSSQKPATETEKAGAQKALLFYALDPPFVANFEGSQAFRFLQVSVRVATRSDETMALLKSQEPIVRNDLLMLFSQQDAEKLSLAAGKKALREEAIKTVRNSVKQAGGKPESVETVLFTSLVMQ